MWLRNCWYVIAWEHEIPAVNEEKLFTRKVLNEPILVYRTTEGPIVAIADKCQQLRISQNLMQANRPCVRRSWVAGCADDDDRARDLVLSQRHAGPLHRDGAGGGRA